MTKDYIRWLQVTDTHLFSNKEQGLLGVKPYQSFQAVVDIMRKEKGLIDFIIHTGDVSQDYTEAAYRYMADTLDEFDVPVYVIPGNHDDSINMAAVYPRGRVKTDKQIVTPHWQCILLDSHRPNAVEGYLQADQLIFLETCLKAYPHLHALVCVHHHPVLMGCKWLDNLNIRNSDAFWAVLSDYPRLKHVVMGHVHQETVHTVQGVTCYSTPATCFQFKRKQDAFGLENLPPGYRWVKLYDDGRLETAVIRTPQYVGEFDAKATGY